MSEDSKFDTSIVGESTSVLPSEFDTSIDDDAAAIHTCVDSGGFELGSLQLAKYGVSINCPSPKRTRNERTRYLKQAGAVQWKFIIAEFRSVSDLCSD